MKHTSPQGFALSLSKTSGMSTPRGLWAGYAQAIANYLTIPPETIVITLGKNEDASEFPILSEERFMIGRPTGDVRNHHPYSIKLIDDSDVSLTAALPRSLSEQELTFLQTAFDHIKALNFQTFQRYREQFIDPKTKLPAEDGLKHSLLQWKEKAYERSLNGISTPPTTLFLCDITCFAMVNKICGESQGDKLLENISYNLIDELKDSFPKGSWYISHIHGDNFAWTVDNLAQTSIEGSEQSKHVASLEKRLARSPQLITRMDSNDRLRIPLHLATGWALYTTASEYDTAIQQANSWMQKYKERSKPAVEANYKKMLYRSAR